MFQDATTIFLIMIERIKHQKWVLLRDTCDYPTASNAYFTMVSEPKLSDDMKGENFQPPLNHFQMDET